MRQAYYKNSIEQFIADDPNRILGDLNLRGIEFATHHNDVNISWAASIPIFQQATRELIIRMPKASKWTILLEYEIPRLGGRIDAVILADDLIYVIEYKDDRAKYELADIRQAEDYALDLFDFHLQSRGRVILPILLAPAAKEGKTNFLTDDNRLVKRCLKANASNLHHVVLESYSIFSNSDAKEINAEDWENSEYRPTPTIIQAAKALFAGQRVESITKSEAEAANISVVTEYIIKVIREAQAEGGKIICFVTGVPGAGKTLVGLNIVHEKESFGGEESNTAYFSGNGPLIKVLKEALARDHFKTQKLLYKSKLIKEKPTKAKSEHEVKTKIQNLHHFIKDGLRSDKEPIERIVVFDEAQRCWDANHFYNKSVRNQNRESQPFNIERKSEAEILFEIMNRHKDWSVIIALVGGGQEINTGEAGIAEWGRVINTKYNNWKVHISPQLFYGDDTTAGAKLFKEMPAKITVFENPDLHLSVSQRSFRATHLNSWVNAVIDNNPAFAFSEAQKISDRYPLLITRDLGKAKDWLRSKMQGNKRTGLVASSGALRLKPFGINVKEQMDEPIWFLNDEGDVRSSYYLEIAATEFAVQGLELDWTCICWDADLRRKETGWDFKSFSGTNWQLVNKTAERQFLLNKYRVLLTRAREGLVIWIPEGDEIDPTRLPEFYDPIFEYLLSCGLTEIT